MSAPNLLRSAPVSVDTSEYSQFGGARQDLYSRKIVVWSMRADLGGQELNGSSGDAAISSRV